MEINRLLNEEHYYTKNWKNKKYVVDLIDNINKLKMNPNTNKKIKKKRQNKIIEKHKSSIEQLRGSTAHILILNYIYKNEKTSKYYTVEAYNDINGMINFELTYNEAMGDTDNFIIYINDISESIEVKNNLYNYFSGDGIYQLISYPHNQKDKLLLFGVIQYSDNYIEWNELTKKYYEKIQEIKNSIKDKDDFIKLGYYLISHSHKKDKIRNQTLLIFMNSVLNGFLNINMINDINEDLAIMYSTNFLKVELKILHTKDLINDPIDPEIFKVIMC